MSMPNPPDTVTWKVTGSQETQRIDAAGNVVRGMVVYYTTGRNNSGSVFIPENVTDLGQIHDVIRAAAEHLNAVNSLTSGS